MVEQKWDLIKSEEEAYSKIEFKKPP